MTWTSDAACRGQTAVMFPDNNGPLDFVEAKTICATCPVTTQCLQAGIDEPYGMWGGLEPAEREKLRGHKYPRRAQIPMGHETKCARCHELVRLTRRNQQYCDDCRPVAAKEKERERRGTARRHQTAEHQQRTTMPGQNTA